MFAPPHDPIAKQAALDPSSPQMATDTGQTLAPPMAGPELETSHGKQQDPALPEVEPELGVSETQDPQTTQNHNDGSTYSVTKQETFAGENAPLLPECSTKSATLVPAGPKPRVVWLDHAKFLAMYLVYR